MNQEFISVKDREITINTLSPRVSSYQKEDMILLDNEEISIVEVQGTNPLEKIPYSSRKMLFKVKVKDDREKHSFRLLCESDEYFFAIQEDFLHLLEMESIDADEMFFKISPRIELLTHTEGTDVVEATVNKRQMNYLSKHTVEELESVSSNSISSEKIFYLVLNKYRSTPSELGLFKLIHDGEGSFRKERPSDEHAVLDKPIAIIVHGLVSNIGPAYSNLFTALSKDFDVYGFEYLTVNERIKDSGILLAKEIEILKKKHPNQEILIVAHSMGGLVSRSAYIEQNAPIDKIIMAGTPNNGSLLVSVPMLARKCLILYGILNHFMGKTTMKSEDFWGLVRQGELQGFHDLANHSEFIDTLNSSDVIDANKKYFALAGKHLGLLNDGIVHTDNMVTINEIKIPHTTNEWNHFTYFKDQDIDIYLKRAINYLK